MTREEYVERMKQQLDEWNARLARWETEMEKGRAGMKEQFRTQLQFMQRQRDELVRRIADLQQSGQAAWGEMSKGLDEAWKTMSSSLERAWSEFQRRQDGPR